MNRENVNKAEACSGILANPWEMKAGSLGKNESIANWQAGGIPFQETLCKMVVYSPILAGKGTSCTAGSRLIT